MPDVSQYTFDFDKVSRLLVKEAGVTSGYWHVVIDFDVNIGLLGTSPEEASPGVMLKVSKFNLVKVSQEEKNLPMVVNAAELED